MKFGRKFSKMRKPFMLIVMVSLIFCGCQVSNSVTPQTSPTSENAQSTDVTLKIVLLPILDALPIYVAQTEGYFEQMGIQVEFVPANSAVERDQIMAAGQADGMVNDLVSTILYDRDSIQIQVVRLARAATADEPVYRIIASPNSNLHTPDDLRGVEIGISQGSVIEYVTDRLLEAEGLTDDEIVTIAVPKISDRMALLSSGGIQAATLPDPFSIMALQDGGTIILDDTSHPEYGTSVISFRKATIDAHPDEIAAFLAAIDQAVEAINANPTGWTSVLKDYNLVPESILSTYVLPTFPADSLPTQEQFEDVVDWAMNEELITGMVSYQDAVYKGK
jgi:NitT/TauT family transport system substrate-binding protein